SGWCWESKPWGTAIPGRVPACSFPSPAKQVAAFETRMYVWGRLPMVIRDPVHGDIYLLPGEEEILDSPPVQRLRGIKQNGTGYLVYPGCVHTRFDHSLGVLAAAQKLLDQVARHGHPVTPREARIVRASALVHDISHIPFGHALEDEAGLFDRHDRRERLDVFLQDGPLAQVLARQGLAEPVTALLTGREHPE